MLIIALAYKQAEKHRVSATALRGNHDTKDVCSMATVHVCIGNVEKRLHSEQFKYCHEEVDALLDKRPHLKHI